FGTDRTAPSVQQKRHVEPGVSLGVGLDIGRCDDLGSALSNIRWLRCASLVLAIAAGGLTACSSDGEQSSGPATTTAQQQMVTVPPESVQRFVAEVRAQGLVPASVSDDEIEFVVQNTCRRAGLGDSYGDLSGGVADLLSLPPAGDAVDDVMTFVYDIGCPEQR
ncbi:MAG: hypothetical protein WAW17_02570, partial [Rhodococcus sp. (in: high G+C Gram-positive bacteria)]|uniref:hypothetical protein n=1 Tax=Rhodococcus sp. TaxID=1831 RepID=UPI003BB12371